MEAKNITRGGCHDVEWVVMNVGGIERTFALNLGTEINHFFVCFNERHVSSVFKLCDELLEPVFHQSVELIKWFPFKVLPSKQTNVLRSLWTAKLVYGFKRGKCYQSLSVRAFQPYCTWNPIHLWPEAEKFSRLSCKLSLEKYFAFRSSELMQTRIIYWLIASHFSSVFSALGVVVVFGKFLSSSPCV